MHQNSNTVIERMQSQIKVKQNSIINGGCYQVFLQVSFNCGISHRTQWVQPAGQH